MVLRPWQKATLLAMYPADGSPSRHETFLISTVKKAGKTDTDAMGTAYGTLSTRGQVALVVANDELQARDRVFDRIAKQCQLQGFVRNGEAIVTKNEISFPAIGSRIEAISSDFAGAAGGLFGITSWTETWAFRHESQVRLWEELTPIPNRRSLRIVDSYAGFTGESPILEPMWARALAGERIHDDLPIFSNGRLWAFTDQGEEAQRNAWLGDPADMAAYYEEQAATLRPGTFERLHLNKWQAGSEAFLSAADWDAITTDYEVPFHIPMCGRSWGWMRQRSVTARRCAGSAGTRAACCACCATRFGRHRRAARSISRRRLRRTCVSWAGGSARSMCRTTPPRWSALARRCNAPASGCASCHRRART